MSSNRFINPFRYLAGGKALLIGLAVMSLTAFIATFSGTHFDGVLDAHFSERFALQIALAEVLVDWVTTVIVFFGLGRLLSSAGFRFLDIAGTLAFARLPMIFVACVGFLVRPGKPDLEALDPSYIVAGLLALPFLVWMVTWLYQAFVTCTNLKGGKATGGFIAALVLAELLSKAAFYYLFHPVIKL